ncbi:dTTP/UTP pyrophosphatase-like [Galleria mellonella]|uniref:dTTP/UTP pyrophosphatase-like n=1 Tax=Galleria mellonella TaxID=7137 RepID=A0A6J1WVL9_GALME|nr:dTTP/UTP pyrophosphatase-like [Galleria mellonella]
MVWLEPLATLLNTNNIQVVFATGSLSRKKTLEEKGLGFVEFRESHCGERTDETDPEKVVKEIALRKAQAVYERLSNQSDVKTIVIGADTIVTIGNRILTKPKGEGEHQKYNSAFNMLKSLSGKENVVVTGLAIIYPDGEEFFHVEKTKVYFSELTDEQISCYVKTKEPMDKAGAYAIQGLAGTFIKCIEGDYFSVLGAPVHAICQILYEWINKKNTK